MWRKKSIDDEAYVFAMIGGFFMKYKRSSLRSMKRREGVFFAEGSKTGMYVKVSCIAKK
jgi:hypothetical protein